MLHQCSTDTSSTYECCRVEGKRIRKEDGNASSPLNFDDLLCEDVIVIICSFLGADELWNNTRRVNKSFRNQTMKDRLWKELYHSRWGLNLYSADSSSTNCVCYHQVINQSSTTITPWWMIYMQRHKWLLFDLNTVENSSTATCEINYLFRSVNCLDDGLVFYERLHSLGKVASECGLCLISQQQELHNLKNSQTYPNNVPQSYVEECILYCKLFLKTYYGKDHFTETKGPSRFFSTVLNLQVVFLLAQLYSIIGSYDRIITFTTECLENIHNIKQHHSSETTHTEEHIMSKIIEKCLFYRGYSSHKLGLYNQAEKDLESAQTLCTLSKVEECSPSSQSTTEQNYSRRYYHLMNILFTLVNNSVKLKQYQKSLEYFIQLISLINSTVTGKESAKKITSSVESLDEKAWTLLNMWFPGVPYFFLAEYLYKQQDYSASKLLFEQFHDYEQGRKYSVHNKHKQNSNGNSKDKQLVHAINRINQINSVIQSDQEY